jgi:3-(3-hydroxy-phenyl)propionate hydroxylase
MPAFVNCQQFYLEQFLIERAREVGGIELRWRHKVTGVTARPDGACLEVESPAGPYRLKCDWLLACDGTRSTVRHSLRLKAEGQEFHDRFLITDVRMDADFPPERWFWFDPPFHPGQSALLHSQPDHVWRIDLQLGWDADPVEEVKPERVIPRLRAMLGKDRRFELEWISIYTFRCRRLARFRHDRIIFLGDAAFGARGFNSGLQDADNLAWKLALVLQGLAPARLLDSYDEERVVAADENIRHSTRSTEFITPKNQASRTYRDAVLALAEHHPFARRMINSGRLSTPTRLDFSSLNTPDRDAFGGGLAPGSPCEDGPLRRGDEPCWLLNQLAPAQLVPAMTLLLFLDQPEDLSEQLATTLDALVREPVPIETRLILTGAAVASANVHGMPALADVEGLVARRCAAAPGSCYLIRPDQHVTGRWRGFDTERVRVAARRALGGTATPVMAMAGE